MQRDGYFDGDLCPPLLEKSPTIVFQPFAGLSAEILPACVNIYVAEAEFPRRATDFSDYSGSQSSHLFRAAAQLLIARLCFVVETIKFRAPTRARAIRQIACSSEKIFHTESKRGDIIHYSNFGGLSSRPLLATGLIDVFEIKPAL